jgi:hypothetical protein
MSTFFLGLIFAGVWFTVVILLAILEEIRSLQK